MYMLFSHPGNLSPRTLRSDSANSAEPAGVAAPANLSWDGEDLRLNGFAGHSPRVQLTAGRKALQAIKIA